MSDDGWLIAAVSGTWTALAMLYGLVPMFDMPGSALVWGSGGAMFWGLTALVARAERRSKSAR